VLHHTVGQRHPGRRVVELDVPGKRRVPRQHDRRRVDRENGHGGDHRPPGDSAVEQRPREPVPDHRERDGHRREGLGERAVERQELPDDDDEREPGRRQEDAGQVDPGDPFDQEATADAERREDERKDEPGDQQCHINPRPGFARRGRSGNRLDVP
jgi:hypothetical protein